MNHDDQSGTIGPTRVHQVARLQRRLESTARLVTPLIHSPIIATSSSSSSEQSNYYANAINSLQNQLLTNNYQYKQCNILSNLTGHNLNNNNESNLSIPGMLNQYHVPNPSIPSPSSTSYYYRSLQYKLRNDKQVCLVQHTKPSDQYHNKKTHFRFLLRPSLSSTSTHQLTEKKKKKKQTFSQYLLTH